MTPRENLLAAFRHQKPEWIPWVPLCGGANTPSFVSESIKRENSALQVALYLNKELGADILVGAGIVEEKHQTAKVTCKKYGDYTSTVYEIAGRTLKSVSRRLPFGEQWSSHRSEYPVKTPADMETLKYLIQDTCFEINPEKFEKAQKIVGDKGIVHTAGPNTPIMNLILYQMGLETFLYSLYDYSRETTELMETIHRSHLEYSKILVSASLDYEVIRSGEDISSLLISPAMFEKYALSCFSDYARIFHQAGKIYMVHPCGHIKDFLPMFLKTGIDALHYLTPPSTGNTHLTEAKKAWGDNITIMGAIEPVRLMQVTGEEVAN